MALTRKQFGKELAVGLTKMCREIQADRDKRGDTSPMDLQIGPCVLHFGGKQRTRK